MAINIKSREAIKISLINQNYQSEILNFQSKTHLWAWVCLFQDGYDAKWQAQFQVVDGDNPAGTECPHWSNTNKNASRQTVPSHSHEISRTRKTHQLLVAEKNVLKT